MSNILGRQTRRQFLARGAAAGAALALSGQPALAYPLGLPLGLQLYAVREQLQQDYTGTLKRIAALGYTEVEAAGFFGHSAEEVRAAMHAAGLSLVSAHYSFADLDKRLDETLTYCKALGLGYLVCSSPGFQDPSRLVDKSYRGQMQSYRLEDFRWTAGRLNEWGQKVKAAGMRLGYHNNTMEFVARNGVVPYDELLRLTDPALVTFELDCGWATVGGGDPEHYLRAYPERISMLHIKDFKKPTAPVTMVDPPPPAELGHGTVAFRSLFEAARSAKVQHIFVEQEGFDMPPFEALHVDAEYMRALRV